MTSIVNELRPTSALADHFESQPDLAAANENLAADSILFKGNHIDIYEFEAHKRTSRAPPAPSCSNGVTENSTLPGTKAHGHQDVIIVGAGFSGISAIYRARKLGLKAKIFEAGLDFGGVWYWNRYPGARVDSEFPFYQLNIPESYKSFDFTERFPDHNDLRSYVAHLDKTLQLRQDVVFDAQVCSAEYDADRGIWAVSTTHGHTATAKYLILATGILHKRYCPDLPGFSQFKGEVCHSSLWPEDMDCSKKKVAVIGAGATAVQIVQELAKVTVEEGSLTMFMRRPSTCFPMRQRNLSPDEQQSLRAYYPALFREGRLSAGGFPVQSAGCILSAQPPEQREKLFEELWARGAFNFLLGNYHDVAVNPSANREVYDFWAKKVRARMSDPVKKDLVAPLEPRYPICTKRPPLEKDLYECLDMKHVDIVDLSANPIKTFTEHGIALGPDDDERAFDVVVLATGFDSFTGSLTNMGLRNKHGVDIKDIWKDGVRTYLGILMNGFPNAFLLYSPQAPTASSNGPTIIETQSDFVFETIDRLEQEHAKSIEPTADAEDEWKRLVTSSMAGSLVGATDSWWNCGNIPGKKSEILTYGFGIQQYEATCREKLHGWQGFVVEKEG